MIEEARTEVRDGEPVRVLLKIRVYETSIVNLPMNPQADVVGAKSPRPGTAVTEGEEEGYPAGHQAAAGADTKKGRRSAAQPREDPRRGRRHGGASREVHGQVRGDAQVLKEMKGLHEEGTKIAESLREFADSHEPDVQRRG